MQRWSLPPATSGSSSLILPVESRNGFYEFIHELVFPAHNWKDPLALPLQNVWTKNYKFFFFHLQWHFLLPFHFCQLLLLPLCFKPEFHFTSLASQLQMLLPLFNVSLIFKISAANSNRLLAGRDDGFELGLLPDDLTLISACAGKESFFWSYRIPTLVMFGSPSTAIEFSCCSTMERRFLLFVKHFRSLSSRVEVSWH